MGCVNRRFDAELDATSDLKRKEIPSVGAAEGVGEAFGSQSAEDVTNSNRSDSSLFFVKSDESGSEDKRMNGVRNGFR